jgi:hypothetical protein
MKKCSSIIIALVLLLMFSTVATARTSGIDRRQRTQRSHIRRGIASGELTRSESRRLAREQSSIRRYEKIAGRDGRISARERVRLNRKLNRAASHIYIETHDRQDRIR